MTTRDQSRTRNLKLRHRANPPSSSRRPTEFDRFEAQLGKLIDKIGFPAMFDPGRPSACTRRKLFGIF